MRVGLIGSTGVVGGAFLELLEERNFPVSELRPFASKASVGKKLSFKGREVSVLELTEENTKDLDFVFIATGEDISLKWSPILAKQGAFVIDNSSAFRLNPDVPLVCPEVNGGIVSQEQKLYANPNCSTIQLVVLLKALKNTAKLAEVTVASYQAVSGAGREALEELRQQSLDSQVEPKQFSKKIAFNSIPQIGSFDDSGFSSEEQKIMKESKKILELPDLKISAQTVRVPVFNGHAESVWVQFGQEVQTEELLKNLESQEGLVFSKQDYITQEEVSGKDEVFVSRVRKDLDFPNRYLFWIVADNIRKGAATNAIQVAELLLKNK